jgi:hypothetical protein
VSIFIFLFVVPAITTSDVIICLSLISREHFLVEGVRKQ